MSHIWGALGKSVRCQSDRTPHNITANNTSENCVRRHSQRFDYHLLYENTHNKCPPAQHLFVSVSHDSLRWPVCSVCPTESLKRDIALSCHWLPSAVTVQNAWKLAVIATHTMLWLVSQIKTGVIMLLLNCQCRYFVCCALSRGMFFMCT